MRDGKFTKDEWLAAITNNNDFQRDNITSISFDGTSVTGDASELFEAYGELQSMYASGLDVSDVTNMSQMFNGCLSLTILDGHSDWNTAKVTNMSQMFLNCWYLASLDLSDWNTGSVTDMSSMFSYCKSFTTLDLSGWITEKLNNTASMFESCSALKTITADDWKYIYIKLKIHVRQLHQTRGRQRHQIRCQTHELYICPRGRRRG